mgnify:CR=1 FL=1
MGLTRSRTPPKAANRSRMPERPRSGWILAPPGPSSLTVTWRLSSAASKIDTRAAGAYFATFVRPSETRKYAAAMTPSGEDKRDLALGVAEVFAYLARMRGDSVALVAGDAEGVDALSGTAASSPRSESTLGCIPATVALKERKAASASS